MSVYVDETQHMGLGLGFFGGGCQSVAVGLEKRNMRSWRKPYHTPIEKIQPTPLLSLWRGWAEIRSPWATSFHSACANF